MSSGAESDLPAAFLAAAKEIAASSEPARLRIAIARVYYANHLLAVIRVPRKYTGWTPKNRGDDHMGVIRHLRQNGKRYIADMLASLKTMRTHADYHIAETLADDECTFCTRGESNLTDRDWESCIAEGEKCFGLLSIF